MRQFIRLVWNTARSELLQWIIQPRLLSVGVLMIFIYQLVIIPLANRSDKIGIPLNRLEPFLAICNSSLVVMLIPLVFLILFSDYPHISPNSLLILSRTGKMSWLCGQLLFAVITILIYLSVLLIGTVVTCPTGAFSTNWSDATTKYEATFPNEYGSYCYLLLPSNLYNQIPLMKALLLSFVWLFCYLLVLILIQFYFRLIHLDSAGTAIEILIIFCGVLSCALNTKWKWIFPMANTIPWIHYTEIIREPIVPIYQTNLYWLFLIILLGIGCIRNIKKYQFL